MEERIIIEVRATIIEVQEFPHLWNIKHSDYKNNQIKHLYSPVHYGVPATQINNNASYIFFAFRFRNNFSLCSCERLPFAFILTLIFTLTFSLEKLSCERTFMRFR